MIKALLMDFDGVMTDNKVYVDQHGIEYVCCSRADGLGINILREKNIQLAIVSTETNKVVSARGEKLGIKVYQSVEDKGSLVKKFCEENNIGLHETAFVGNDINDIPAFNVVQKKICPNDSVQEVKFFCDYILSSNGGDGVIREIADNYSKIFCDYE